MNPATSVSLLARLQRPGDTAAWERFVHLYTPLLYHWALRAGMSSDEADDLVQDIFLTLVHKLPSFQYDPSRSFHAWLRTVAMNRWRDWAESQARRRAEPLPELAEPDDIDDFIEREYRARLAKRALEVMRVDFQESTWRACWEMVVNARPAEEVAKELNMTVGACHAARLRVLTRLRRELAGMLE